MRKPCGGGAQLQSNAAGTNSTCSSWRGSLTKGHSLLRHCGDGRRVERGRHLLPLPPPPHSAAPLGGQQRHPPANRSCAAARAAARGRQAHCCSGERAGCEVWWRLAVARFWGPQLSLSCCGAPMCAGNTPSCEDEGRQSSCGPCGPPPVAPPCTDLGPPVCWARLPWQHLLGRASLAAAAPATRSSQLWMSVPQPLPRDSHAGGRGVPGGSQPAVLPFQVECALAPACSRRHGCARPNKVPVLW